MDLNDHRQRKLLFAGIAAGLVLLGMWLVWPRPDTTPRPSSSASAAAPRLPAGVSASPQGISATVDPDTFDIYRLLPYGQKDFASAAGVAQQFVAAYGTYRYDEDPETYLGRLRPYVIDAVYEDLKAAAASPGILEQRKNEQTVATGSASLNSIRSIGNSSIIFEVTGGQEVSGAASKVSKVWAVTVQNEGGAWRVFSFVPADEGQAGDEP